MNWVRSNSTCCCLKTTDGTTAGNIKEPERLRSGKEDARLTSGKKDKKKVNIKFLTQNSLHWFME